jgi:hypothetical protein
VREPHRRAQQVYLVYVTGTYYIYVNLDGAVNEAVPRATPSRSAAPSLHTS